jgi:hypothetical protein
MGHNMLFDLMVADLVDPRNFAMFLLSLAIWR